MTHVLIVLSSFSLRLLYYGHNMLISILFNGNSSCERSWEVDIPGPDVLV